MPSHVQTERPLAQKDFAGAGPAHHRTETAARHALASDTPDAALNQSLRSQSLLQTRQALEDSPGVRSQLALQRELNRRRPRQADATQDSRKISAPVQRKPNATGLPDHLKAGVEHLSGLAMDDVRVHYNSPKPAAMQALAYAQGTDIHVAPGQEKHLPHEAWHVVQQKQGRVKPTLQLKGVAINDDTGLEREADMMGRRVLAPLKIKAVAEQSLFRSQGNSPSGAVSAQRKVWLYGALLDKGEDFNRWDTLQASEQKTLQGLIDDSETKDRNFNVFTLLQAIGSQQYTLNTAAVSNMIKPLERGEASGLTSHKADSGVGEGDVASYAVVQYLEKVGDGLTGDHQPSGAAVKEALRQALHLSKQGPLTRGNARNAYKRAITVVVTEAWHLAKSRTFGGRNNPQQIQQDAANLFQAAVQDFNVLAKSWRLAGWTDVEIANMWQELHNARQQFFDTGEMQAGSMS